MKQDKPVYCIDGQNLASAKRIAKLLFDESVITVDINHSKASFDIIVKDDADKKSIEKLIKQYPSFNVIIATLKSYK